MVIGGELIKKVFYKCKWADNTRIVGLLKILYFNVAKINRFIIFEWDISENIDAMITNSSQYEIAIVDSKELSKYLQGNKLLPREFYMNVIGGLKHCVSAIKDNQIIHICWIYMAGDKNRFFNIKPDEAHLDYAFTFPEYRGLRLNIQSHLKAARWLKEQNIRRILLGVHEDTKYMLSSLEKIAKIKQIGTLTHWFIYRPKFKG